MPEAVTLRNAEGLLPPDHSRHVGPNWDLPPPLGKAPGRVGVLLQRQNAPEAASARWAFRRFTQLTVSLMISQSQSLRYGRGKGE